MGAHKLDLPQLNSSFNSWGYSSIIVVRRGVYVSAVWVSGIDRRAIICAYTERLHRRDAEARRKSSKKLRLRFHPAGTTADSTESRRKLISRRLRVSAVKSLSTHHGRQP